MKNLIPSCYFVSLAYASLNATNTSNKMKQYVQPLCDRLVLFKPLVILYNGCLYCLHFVTHAFFKTIIEKIFDLLFSYLCVSGQNDSFHLGEQLRLRRICGCGCGGSHLFSPCALQSNSQGLKCNMNKCLRINWYVWIMLQNIFSFSFSRQK